ncbi:hypothetical protein [Kitasatospora sp. NPDC127116]|uniref:hypothetical protein n=1 Tax=Kitasatospora sp. NPDC127116 TaxID=3345367 RepID=UPI003639E8D1
MTDVVQTVQRPAAEQREPGPRQPGDLFRHRSLLEELVRSLLDARPEPSPGASPTRSRAPAASGSGTGEPGLPVTLFALGRQAVDGPPGGAPEQYATESDASEADPVGSSWFEVFTPEEEAGLEDDTAETEEQPPADGPPEDTEESLQARRQKMAEWLRRARADLSLVPRLLLVRVLLDFLAKDA